MAERGRPSGALMIASMSSTFRPLASMRFMALDMSKTPMRLAMKLGTSLQRTTPLPSTSSQKRLTYSTTSFFVSPPGMSSTSFMYRGGLKKWMPRNRSLRPLPRLAEISPIRMPEVLVATMQRGFTAFSTFAKRSCLILRFSMTASMTRSTPASHARLSSKLPGLTIAALRFV
ncbi:MAG: hypothetical protein BWY00_01773 [Firmicutes bacterium ADurb.Bin153]|nr:MAG: hypothetical protein BWY00_01773 [Firmicutes bacterium ADurb.Bin153]